LFNTCVCQFIGFVLFFIGFVLFWTSSSLNFSGAKEK